jgi:hypothetical protein
MTTTNNPHPDAQALDELLREADRGSGTNAYTQELTRRLAAALRASLQRESEAREDTERLDWLEAQRIEDRAWFYDGSLHSLEQSVIKHSCLVSWQYFKARQAIDAARSAARIAEES